MQRPIYEESRRVLCDKIATNIQSSGSIVRQVVKGSRTGDILSASARNFATLDQTMNSTENNLQKMVMAQNQFHQQLDNIAGILEENSRKILPRH